MAERPKFYVTLNIQHTKARFGVLFLKPIKKTLLQNQILKHRKRNKILENTKHKSRPEITAYLENKIDLLDYCDKWIKEYKIILKEIKRSKEMAVNKPTGGHKPAYFNKQQRTAEQDPNALKKIRTPLERTRDVW